jgi:hypothetical protein
MSPAAAAAEPDGLLATGGLRAIYQMILRGVRRIGIAAVLLAIALGPAQAEDREITKARLAQRTSFSDAEIIDGFFKLTFGAEFALAGRTDRIRKYDKPVLVYVEGRVKPDRRAEVARVVADIRARVHGLDISLADKRERANVVVRLARDRDLLRAIRTAFGRQQASRINRSLDPQCLSGFSKDANYRILSSKVILVADAGDFIFYDCAYEELLQALGPINDDETVPWTMFNDDVQMGFFGIYDQYIMNLLYHPRIRPGMTREEVRALLPEIMPGVREWVARVNNLKP